MASGKFGSASLTAATLTQIYAGPASGKVATVNVCFVNAAASASAIRLAISTSSTSGGVAAADYVSYGATLNVGDEYEKTGLVVQNGEYVWAYAAVTGVVARAHGFEGAA